MVKPFALLSTRKCIRALITIYQLTELNTFRIKYRHLKVVIIDEISMVGNMTLSFIDTRLQQLTGSKAAFGGLSVIAVGDLYQLKPVGDFDMS